MSEGLEKWSGGGGRVVTMVVTENTRRKSGIRDGNKCIVSTVQHLYRVLKEPSPHNALSKTESKRA